LVAEVVPHREAGHARLGLSLLFQSASNFGSELCVTGGGIWVALVSGWLEGLVIMHIVKRFKIKSYPQAKSGEQANGSVALHPASLRGVEPGAVVSITNTRNGKRVFCIIKTDVDLLNDQIGIGYALQKKLEIEKHIDNKGIILAIASRPMPYHPLFWINHPDERVRIPVVLVIVLALVSLIISLLLIRF